MLFSYEFILTKPIDLCIGAFFETSLYQRGEYVRKSFGSDNFHVSTTLEGERRLSALGRNCVIQVPFKDLPTKIEVQKPSLLELPSISDLEILCKTNIFLSKESFYTYLTLLLQINKKMTTVPLIDCKDKIISIDQGRYLISLSNIIIDKKMKKSAP